MFLKIEITEGLILLSIFLFHLKLEYLKNII
jgi:hypothetical protein